MKPKPRPSLVLQLAIEEAERARVTVRLIFSNDQRRAVCWARWRVFRRLSALGYSLHGIGDAMGVDHSTVHYGLQKDTGIDTPELRRRKCGLDPELKPMPVDPASPPPVSKLRWSTPTVWALPKPRTPPMTIVVSRAAMMGSGREIMGPARVMGQSI